MTRCITLNGHCYDNTEIMVKIKVFNATFNNISVLLVEEIGVPGENLRPTASHWQTSSHIVVSSTPLHERDSNSKL